MKTFKFCKAENVLDSKVDSVRIELSEDIPANMSQSDMRDLLGSQANELVNLIVSHLPRGVLSQFHGLLMIKRAENFAGREFGYQVKQAQNEYIAQLEDTISKVKVHFDDRGNTVMAAVCRKALENHEEA